MKPMSPQTQEIYDAILDSALRGTKSITANVFTHCFSRSHVAPAIRRAKLDGIIVECAKSIVGNPIYEAGPAVEAMLQEATDATRH